MVIQREYTTHRRGLHFKQQQKVYVLRKHDKLSWAKIAGKVKNLENKKPYWKVCRDAFNRLNLNTGRATYNYKNCGRPAVLTTAVKAWIVSRLLSLRRKEVCTSSTLTRKLAAKKDINVEASRVRRVLQDAGYHWLSRSKKPKYSAPQMLERVSFSDKVLKFTQEELEDKECHLSLDGIILTVPPKELVARGNYCRAEETHAWRKKEEQHLPELAGNLGYKNQVPLSRAVPMWGGVGPGGFAVVLWHENRKLDSEEWAEAVNAGNMERALRQVNPGKRGGPWKILTDNESFLRAGPAAAAHRRAKVRLWERLPAKSPDLNPVEKFWAWLRKRLRAADLKDLNAKREPVGKTEFKRRVRRLIVTEKAKLVASNIYRDLRNAAQECKDRGGAATTR